MDFRSRDSGAALTLAICARRAEGIIGRCLASIDAQTRPPDRVVVAVHEWDDPTVDVARAYGAEIIAHHGSGLFEGRQAVLDACTTDYLAFTDADCELAPEWVAGVHRVFTEHPEVAAGTGRHPPIGARTFAAWLHHMWFLVETCETGETGGVIGGNSYFRTEALRSVGGWPSIPGCVNAEDVYISFRLREAGYGIWFDGAIAAQHHFEARFLPLMRKSVRMGWGITRMMQATGAGGALWWYTLAIPVLAVMVLAGLALAPFWLLGGSMLAAVPLLGTLAYLTLSFGSLGKAVPRWAARWIVIWPYAWGILRAFATPRGSR